MLNFKESIEKIKLNLQMFTEADGGEGGTEGGEDNSGAGQEGENSQGGEDKGITLTAEQLNAQIQTAVQEAVRLATEQAQTEAERLSKMNDEERATYKQAQLEKKLREKEAELQRRELRAEAIEEIEKRELPKGLVDLVALDNAEACNNSINSIEKAFKEAVEVEVEKRLTKSAYVPGGSGGKQKAKAGTLGASLAKNAQPKESVKSAYFKD